MSRPTARSIAAKIHFLTDVLGRPDVPMLTPGDASSFTILPVVLAEALSQSHRPAADKGYDADWPWENPR